MTVQDKLEHVAYALSLQGAVALVLALASVANPAWIGAAAAIGVFYGREERDDENRHKGNLLWRPWRSFLPWSWSADGMLDFAAPALAVIVAATAATLLAG